ncbi:MAG: PilW family protein [Deltaproteobacteria bacterium]|nr:PilW family protein [Deltaproteobacteria bacterium]
MATALSGIVLTGIYSSYYSQQKSYVAQGQISSMQQNLRAALYHMEREIRMAGYDPIGGSGAGIQTSGTDSIRITMDITDDSGTGDPDGDAGDAGEDITYSLADTDDDGDNDLARNDANGSGTQTVAEDIDALNLVYLNEEDSTTSTLSEIRSVQISIVARTGQGDPGYSNNNAYSNQQDTEIFPASGDNHRRRLLTEQVKCRNLGLE